MADREITDRQRGWLTGELTYWQGVGLVSADQSARILDLYGTPQEISDRRTARGLLRLSSLAALLVGLGVLLLIGYNWEALPAAAKLVIIFGTLVATHAAGLVL